MQNAMASISLPSEAAPMCYFCVPKLGFFLYIIRDYTLLKCHLFASFQCGIFETYRLPLTFSNFCSVRIISRISLIYNIIIESVAHSSEQESTQLLNVRFLTFNKKKRELHSPELIFPRQNLSLYFGFCSVLWILTMGLLPIGTDVSIGIWSPPIVTYPSIAN